MKKITLRFFSYSAVALILSFWGCQPEHKVNMSIEHTPDTLELFAPGVISTGLYERDIAISSDGKEILYTLGNHKQTSRCLVSIKRTHTGWGNREMLPFSGKYHDIEPAFSTDGNTLFFASTRPLPNDITRDDYNIWRVDRLDGIWGDPEPLSELINTAGGEFYPSLTKSGDLYFTATRDDGIGKEDIYVSRLSGGVYLQPEVLDTNINTATYEFNAFISPDEDVLIFGSYGRPDDLGGGDMYISRMQADGGWSKSVNMGAQFNSSKLDYCPFVDYPRGNFYFTSERTIDHKAVTVEDFIEVANLPGNGLGDLYRIAYTQVR
jgi:Tol biopolymer transport system component